MKKNLKIEIYFHENILRSRDLQGPLGTPRNNLENFRYFPHFARNFPMSRTKYQFSRWFISRFLIFWMFWKAECLLFQFQPCVVFMHSKTWLLWAMKAHLFSREVWSKLEFFFVTEPPISENLENRNEKVIRSTYRCAILLQSQRCHQKSGPGAMIPTKKPIQNAGSAVLNSWSRLSRATRSWCSTGLFAMVWNGYGTVSDEFRATKPLKPMWKSGMPTRKSGWVSFESHSVQNSDNLLGRPKIKVSEENLHLLQTVRLLDHFPGRVRPRRGCRSVLRCAKSGLVA